MPKKPSVRNKYAGFSPGLARANQKKAKKDKLPKTPWKETKLPVGGD